ncbi:unnamed protein product, partial [Symbiodinium necroappetens]
MGGGASAPQPQATGSPDAAILAENERLKKEIDAVQKRADSAEASQKAAVAKQSEFEKLNAELESVTKNSDARNERAKALAQAELVSMAKVWRAERTVEECRGIKEVSQARLEFWHDAHETAIVKTKDTAGNHATVSRSREDAAKEAAEAAAAEDAARQRLEEAEAVALEANRQAADFREKERQAHVASFDFASAVASAETAIVDAQQ